MTLAKNMTKLEVTQQSFDCCIQIVKSYGPLLDEKSRKSLTDCMEHFKRIYEDAIRNDK